MSVVIETTVGDFTVDLFLEDRPRTCLNFLKLCKVKYYNFSLFHKIERNFIAQCGDPTGTGRGGESIYCQLYGEQAKYFEAETKPRLKHKKLGTLSMVNNGENMNGSQFFVTLGEDLTYLDNVHTVFGEVVEGFDILMKLNETICDDNNRPYQDIRITHTVVLHDPHEDPTNLDIPPYSPEPTKELLASNYVGVDEEIDDTKGRSIEEIEEEIRNKEAKARATILEMVGDIPDVDVKPPDTVLFVCKLNPVTTSEDLEIIFSRFGTILSCEVIKDQKTGESLQYAFIEFEKEPDCENAYFKMDNVLIDDRRIHVDFSQSVSKLNYKHKPRGPKKDSFVIKDNIRKSGGYDMVFDTDNVRNKLSQHDEKDKRKRPDFESKDRNRRSNYETEDMRRSDLTERGRSEKYSSSQSRRSYEQSPEKHHSHSYEYKHHSNSSSSHKHKHKKQKSRSPSPYHKRHKSSSKHKKSRH